jgi:hypothetical protein
MRCLYCGKELALLKRLRGGGEFCSDAHRQSYQEEYNQLALTRLLQAKPPAEAKLSEPPPPVQSPGKPSGPNAVRETAPVPEAPQRIPHEPAAPAPVSRAAVMEAEPPVYKRPASQPPSVVVAPEAKEERAPAELAGYMAQSPSPAVMPIQHASTVELGRMTAAVPALPSGDLALTATATTGQHWSAADQVALELSMDARNYETARSDRGLEVREFLRSAPVVEIPLHATGENLPEPSSDELEIGIELPPRRAGSQPAPSLFGPREFPGLPAELGDLARLDFAPEKTAGDAVTEAAVTPAPEESAPAAPVAEPERPEEIALPEPQLAKPIRQPVTIEPVRIEAAYLESVTELRPRGSVVRTPAESPLRIEPAVKALPAPPPEEPAPVEEAPEADPEMVTKPAAVTLHGLAAGRGRSMQVFASALAATIDVQAPRLVGLPLRPAMVFGRRPSVKEQKEDARRAGNGKSPRPEFRTSSGPKPSATAPVAPTPSAKNPASKPVSVPPLSQPRTESPKPQPEVISKPFAEVKPPAETKTADLGPLPEPKFDLGLPSLELQSASGWAKLPLGAKIALAAVLVAAIGGGVYYFMNGSHMGSHAATQAQQVRVAPGLPLPDAGWVADWIPESVDAGRGRRISLLRSSMPLSDYRIEFRAQIESKAVGWVFRGMDPKNYYVAKLEIVKPGLEPAVVLKHFAVINGRDQDVVERPLPMQVRVDTTYNIRFDAVGKVFTAWVQDQKIDEWTDDRIASGGAGLISERGESAPVQGIVNVVPLVVQN